MQQYGLKNFATTMSVFAGFALQGIPCIYYGTEQGLNGAYLRLSIRESLKYVTSSLLGDGAYPVA
jgi:glycosidase